MVVQVLISDRRLFNNVHIDDIEADLMIGSHHKSAVLVMTARATLVNMIEQLSSKNADEVYRKRNE